jgi:hypothetical protein
MDAVGLFRDFQKTLRHFVLVALAGAVLPSRAGAEPSLREFSEKQVAGGKNDFMIVRLLKLRGSNEAIGRKLAEIARSRHGTEPTAESVELTKKRWQFYKTQYPTHHARSAGAADFFGAPVDGPADTMALLFNMDISPACSVVYYPPEYTASGHAILSRNYDFSTSTYAEIIGQAPAKGTRPMTGDPYIIEMYPDEGYASLYLCAYELLGGCLDGINEHGVTVAMLANGDPQAETPPQPSDTWRAALSEIEIPRFVLDRCKNVDEARDLLMQVPIYYSFIPCHYIIGDRSGRSIIWEYDYDLKARHVVEGKGRPQVITNHPVHKYETDGKARKELGESWGRYRRLSAEIAKAPKGRSVDDIRRANACIKAKGPPTPRGPNLPPRLERTLWYALYDCHDLSVEIDFYLGEDPAALNGEKRSGYLRFTLDGANSVARSP